MQEWWVNTNKNAGSTWSRIYTRGNIAALRKLIKEKYPQLNRHNTRTENAPFGIKVFVMRY
jgi:hypothetical protein